MRVRTHVNPLAYVDRMDKLDYKHKFPYNQFLDFEVGCGRGIFLKEYAKKYKDRNIIGVEIRKPVVEQLKIEIMEENIENVFVVQGRAEFCLEDTLEDASLDRVFIFHPDPWIKRTHHKRRVVSLEFLEIIYKKLKKNGELYISTDVEDLWVYMKNIIDKYGKFELRNINNFWEEDYITNWTDFSKKNNRDIFYGTFLKKD
jgi:tRNA (guanine-N7-)-methyltransferase